MTDFAENVYYSETNYPKVHLYEPTKSCFGFGSVNIAKSCLLNY